MVKILISFILLFIFCAFELSSEAQESTSGQLKKSEITQAAKKTPTTALKTKTPVAMESIKKGVSIDELQGSRLAAAMGHFSRARHLLMSAIKEFDAGTKIANPDLLLDSNTWRKGVLFQASELEKVLAPQAAQAKGGIKYQGDSRLLTESKP